MEWWSNVRKMSVPVFVVFVCIVIALRSVGAAENLNQIIGAAKNEPELNFIASAQAFGGPRAFADIEAGVNKRFGLSTRIRFTGGPEMNGTPSCRHGGIMPCQCRPEGTDSVFSRRTSNSSPSFRVKPATPDGWRAP